MNDYRLNIQIVFNETLSTWQKFTNNLMKFARYVDGLIDLFDSCLSDNYKLNIRILNERTKKMRIT